MVGTVADRKTRNLGIFELATTVEFAKIASIYMLEAKASERRQRLSVSVNPRNMGRYLD